MKDEALKLALEALELNNNEWKALADSGDCGNWRAEDQDHYKQTNDAITAIKAALEQPAHEPVAHLWECLGRWSVYLVANGKQADCAPPSWLVDAIQNATTPPKREWVGLTDDDLTLCESEEDVRFVRAIEDKLRSKNT